MKSEYRGARRRHGRRSGRNRADARRGGRRHSQRAGRRSPVPPARRAAAVAPDPGARRRNRRRGDGSPGDLGDGRHRSGGSGAAVQEIRSGLAAGDRSPRRAPRPHHRGRHRRGARGRSQRGFLEAVRPRRGRAALRLTRPCDQATSSLARIEPVHDQPERQRHRAVRGHDSQPGARRGADDDRRRARGTPASRP